MNVAKWEPMLGIGVQTGSWTKLGNYVLITAPVTAVEIDPETVDAAPFVDKNGNETLPVREQLSWWKRIFSRRQPREVTATNAPRGKQAGSVRWVTNVRREENHVICLDNAGRGFPTEESAKMAGEAFLSMNGLLYK